MATSITSSTHAVRNPAITSKKLIEFREANLGFEATVSKKYTDEAKVGTTIRWGSTDEPSASTKSEGNSGNDITYDVTNPTAITMTINQHQYRAFEIEEFQESLSIVDDQSVETHGAMFAVNRAIDDTLAALIDNATQTEGTLAIDLTDDNIRRADQYLNDANAPREDRFLAISPASVNSMLAIDRYVSSDFNRGGISNIVKGTVGEVYNTTVWNSTNVEGTNAAGHDNGLYHRDFFALALRMQPRVREFDDIQNLSTQVAVSAIWGVIETRDDHCVFLKGA